MKLKNLIASPQKISTNGLLALEGPFSFSEHPKKIVYLFLIGIVGLIIFCSFPDFLPLQWLISRPAAILQESIFAALLGKLIWDCTEMLIREYQESKTHLNSLVPAVVSIASASLIAILTLPFVYGVILSVLFGLMFYYFKTTKAHSRLNIDPLALSFVFLIGIEAAIPLESLSFLIWNSFFETNGFLLVPLEILTAILVGYLLPLPLSLGGGAYLAFFIFGWPGMWGALLLFAFIMAVNLKMFGAIKKIKLLDKKIVHAIKIPFVCSATVSFLFMIINYPLDLNWSSRSLFLCLLSLGLSIRKWSFYRVFSLGLIVAMTEISLEFLSGSLSS